jgi:hypothetical protein
MRDRRGKVCCCSTYPRISVSIQPDSHQIPTAKMGAPSDHQYPHKTPGPVRGYPRNTQNPPPWQVAARSCQPHPKGVRHMIEHVAARPKPFLPVIHEFQGLVEPNSILFRLCHNMFRENTSGVQGPARDPTTRVMAK